MRIIDRQKTLYSVYNKKDAFTLNLFAYAEFFNLYFLGCIKADLADNGDSTTQLLHEFLPAEIEVSFIAKSSGIFSGEEEVAYIARKMGLKLRKGLTRRQAEIVAGTKFQKGDVLFSLVGK